MTIEHKLITDPDLHELKGASTAALDRVPVADGLGSNTWSRSIISDHAEMAITNNSTATAIVAAVDPTLNTDTDYVKITAGWAVTHSSGITFAIDKLQVSVGGDYQMNFWGAVKIPLNNNFIGIKYAINDTTPYSLQKIVTQSATTNDYRNVFASGVITLSANDTISVYIAGSKTDSPIIEEAGMQMVLLHEA